MLTLHAVPLSPFAQKVHYFIEELGIPYTYKSCDLAGGEQRSAAFRSLNPFGAVPTIELDGFSLGESDAILRYLARHYQRTDWYPENLEDRARVDQAMDFVGQHVNRWLVRTWWQNRVVPSLFRGTPDQVAVEDSRTRLLVSLAKLESYFSGRNYLAGPTPTLADVVLLPCAAIAAEGQVSLADYPQTVAWLARMTQRKAWGKVRAEYEKVFK
jgi:glutathione S-transferase